ncbi:hypothetical protein [Variovorax sp. KK3]|uniref:hypothetical protein n=1 Tax=Variovorax sp. KK3 TaxID=1855728 RepID=UPI003AACCE08
MVDEPVRVELNGELSFATGDCSIAIGVVERSCTQFEKSSMRQQFENGIASIDHRRYLRIRESIVIERTDEVLERDRVRAIGTANAVED